MSGTAVSRDGTQIAWSAAGDGPPLVVIDPVMVDRGLSPNSSLAGKLASGFTVIRYDRRGKGDSGGDLGRELRGGLGREAMIDPQTEVEDLAAVIVAASPGVAPVVFGLSSGGSIGVLAASEGVSMSALVVMEPPSSLDDVGEFIARCNSLVVEGRDSEAVRSFLAFQGMPEEVVGEMADYVDACAPYAWTIPVDLRVTELLTPDALLRVDVPVLAVGSAASPPQLQEFAEFVGRHVPRSEVRLLDGDWHGIPDDDLAAAIAAFGMR